MGDYKLDPKEEKKPSGLLPTGEVPVEIFEMTPKVSKGGNNMFETVLKTLDGKITSTIYLVNEPKKRWMLKLLLQCIGHPAGEDGTYDFSVSDILGKKVIAIVEHEEQDWINREGEKVKQKRANITDFLPYNDAAEKLWNEK